MRRTRSPLLLAYYGDDFTGSTAIGAAYGALNAFFITRFAIMAFVVTLATRYLGRGLGLRITQTRAMSLPESFYQLGAARICAAAAGIVALSQAPAVSPTFGNNREFMAIAAAVLGGTSLFGGRGAVFSGTVLGAVLIQTIENGLTILNVDSYLYPLITSGIIFVAVLLDATRCRVLARVNQRKVFVESCHVP